MSGSLSLNGTWELGYSVEFPDALLGEQIRGRALLQARVPAPVHQVLLDAGVIEDPNIGLNSMKARWVEEEYWVYRRTFSAPEEAHTRTAWLTFAGLEMCATIYLNGEEIGRHANAHLPARLNVTGKLRPGENLLVVTVESGLYAVADKPGGVYDGRPREMLTKRAWLRKAQYQAGWDWNPRMQGVGIMGDVALEWRDTPRLGQVTVFAVPSADHAAATITARATVEGLTEAPVEAALHLRVRETGDEAVMPVTIAQGEARHEIALTLANPRLWWPAGHGEQPLYTVDVTLAVGDDAQVATRRTGVRRIEIDRSRHPETGEYFIITINGRPIFCKGGNWVPPDLLPARVTPERYRALVDLALGANFNLLRIWGGAVYAHEALCDACDEAGILIWHDLLFACSRYPGDDPEFAAEARREVRYGMRELAHHPSLVIWCGNNEIEWGDCEWGYDRQARMHPHYYLFHHDFPLIAREEDPTRPYWISSPYSPGLLPPNDPTVGDQHPWLVSFEQGAAEWWKYRQCVDRFPNEGGVLGASSPATLRQFLPEDQRYPGSLSWEHHDNTLNHATVPPRGDVRLNETIRLWLGADPHTLEMESYALASGLLQAEGLTEYITNYRRRMFSSASAIFWMYNDSWPVTHGWTIVDYYLRKKLAYHPVRRAFQPVTVVVADEGEMVGIYGVNDSPRDWQGEVRCGLVALAGGYPRDERLAVTLPANASTRLASFPKAEWEAAGLTQSGTFAVLMQDGRVVAQHRLFLERFGNLAFAEPTLTLEHADGMLTLTSDVYAWGVCLDTEGEAPVTDNCFDLLPGVPYQIAWPAELGEPAVKYIGSRDAQRKPVVTP